MLLFPPLKVYFEATALTSENIPEQRTFSKTKQASKFQVLGFPVTKVLDYSAVTWDQSICQPKTHLRQFWVAQKMSQTQNEKKIPGMCKSRES